MSAHGDNPQVHRIVVEATPEGEDCGEREVLSIRFVCDAGPDAPCHQWPDCACEEWGESVHFADEARTIPAPGHEPVPQEACWIDPWFNDALDGPIDWLDAWDGDGDPPTWSNLRSGPISVTFEGEWMTWEYAAVDEPLFEVRP